MSLLAIDTSLWHHRAHPAVLDGWAEALGNDRIGITPVVQVEVLYSARSHDEYRQIAVELSGLRAIPCTTEACARAVEVQAALAQKGGMHHRSVGLSDLLIAAAAELAEATVWHYDEDYDRIAAVTGQPTEWVVPRGSL